MTPSRKSMVVAGVMSGTSADGINVALVKIGGGASASEIQLLGHAEYPYPGKVRAAVLAAMNAEAASVADLARLNFLLGELYADAVLNTQRKFRVKAELVGCHGQTLYHQGEAKNFLGGRVACTWQTGEGAIIAARTAVSVVSDFRPADMAAGGKGAPLVPFLDYLLFRDAKVGRIVLNIGGIANLTAIPAGAKADEVVAFDTGPGNMIIDAVMMDLYGRAMDRGGRVAASGTVIEPIAKAILKRKFFQTRPPKTAGREEFGREFVREFIRNCRGARNEDIVATATALTARSIADAVQRFLVPRGVRHSFREMILSGGGGHNSTLVKMLLYELRPFPIHLRLTDEFGLPSDAKEAAAFAVMAYETWNRRPSNVPSATGAKRAAVLGKLSYA